MNHIADNLAAIQERMADAARRAGRRKEPIRLVAVTKYVGREEIEALLAAGCRDLGESRPQALWERATWFPDANWRLVGHLQRNKARRTLPLVASIDSVDSLRLLETLDSLAGEMELRPRALLEVNVSGDPEKHGLDPEELPSLAPRLAELKAVAVDGLLTMAAREGDLDVARRNFAHLRELRDRLRSDCPPAVTLDELSMGMSRDFEAAIEEGATMVRIGSALFEPSP